MSLFVQANYSNYIFSALQKSQIWTLAQTLTSNPKKRGDFATAIPRYLLSVGNHPTFVADSYR